MITSTDRDLRDKLEKAKKKFQILPTEIKGSTGRFAGAIANELVKRARDNYKDFEARVNTYDHQAREGAKFYKEITDNGYVVIASGPQIVYDEYGTGDRGEASPHPFKPSYLDDYNSHLVEDGGHIRTTTKGTHYWNYYSTKLGQVVRSSGVESGHFMYDAFTEVEGAVAANICLKGLKSTVRKTIKGAKTDAFTADLLKEIDGE